MRDINRRNFLAALGAMAATAALPGKASAEPDQRSGRPDIFHGSVPEGPPEQIALLIYPKFTALDLIGPHTFLAALGNVKVHLVWKSLEPVTSDNGLRIHPNASFNDCPQDLRSCSSLAVSSTIELMNDTEVLGFLRDRGARAKYVTSVCTGFLVLGAAGLLNGYKATSYWLVPEMLPLFGADLVNERVVMDRNGITGAGVTAGIDFGLSMAARLRDEPYAEMLQLAFEYDP